MITLFQDKVLIREESNEFLYGYSKDSGIVIPDYCPSWVPIVGVVVNTGPGKVFVQRTEQGIKVKGAHKSYLKVGQKVLVQKNTEYKIKINGEWLILVKEGDVIGVLE